jgi:chromosome segregation ATPase
MDRKQTEARVDELRRERATVESALADARAAARQALIDGTKPTQKTAELAERLSLIDEALAELQDRVAASEEADQRKRRVAAIEKAQHATAGRRELAAAVDAALAALSDAWRAYVDGVRTTLGSAVQAGADTVPLARVALNGGQADALVKAMVASSGMDLVRALGVQTSNRPNHGVALAAGEDRVLRSLETELLRVRATSPMPNIARDARKQLEQMEQEN